MFGEKNKQIGKTQSYMYLRKHQRCYSVAYINLYCNRFARSFEI